MESTPAPAAAGRFFADPAVADAAAAGRFATDFASKKLTS